MVSTLAVFIVYQNIFLSPSEHRAISTQKMGVEVSRPAYTLNPRIAIADVVIFRKLSRHSEFVITIYKLLAE